MEDRIKEMVIDIVRDAVDEAFDEQCRERASSLDDKTKEFYLREFLRDFSNNPSNFRFQKLYNDFVAKHQNQLAERITDDQLVARIEKYFKYPETNQYVGDKIVSVILNNWSTLKENPQIKEAFAGELEALRRENQVLQWKLNDMGVE